MRYPSTAHPLFLRLVEGGDGGGSGKPAGTEPAGDSTSGEEALGDAGKRALDAMKTERNEERRRRREAEQELERIKAEAAAQGKPAEEQALDAARREAEQAVMARVNDRIVKAEVRAAATGKLADPTDALRFIDLSSIEVGEDGAVDGAAVADAIADLIKTKPYLATGARPAPGSADGGPRKAATDPTIDEQIADAHKRGDWRAVVSLQNSKLAPSS